MRVVREKKVVVYPVIYCPLARKSQFLSLSVCVRPHCKSKCVIIKYAKITHLDL